MKQEFITNIPVDNKSYEEIIRDIKNALKEKQQYTIISINPKKIILANNNEKLKKGIINASCHIPDGSLVVKKCKYINKRVTGIDLMNRICANASKIGGKIFLYGAQKNVVELTKKNLEAKYQNINIVGICDGYVDDNIALQKINSSKANILFVAMGSPKQELWIFDNLKKIKANIIMGVGGSFDVVSGNKKRAPKIFIKLNIEWLYRVITEPKRFKDTFIYLKYILMIRKNK